MWVVLALAGMTRRIVLMLGKQRFWKLRFLLSALVLLLLGSAQLYGQSQAITSSLSGSILDPSGSSVANAKVTLNVAFMWNIGAATT